VSVSGIIFQVLRCFVILSIKRKRRIQNPKIKFKKMATLPSLGLAGRRADIGRSTSARPVRRDTSTMVAVSVNRSIASLERLYANDVRAHEAATKIQALVRRVQTQTILALSLHRFQMVRFICGLLSNTF
jgi:hypothetical protein